MTIGSMDRLEGNGVNRFWPVVAENNKEPPAFGAATREDAIGVGGGGGI